MPVKEEEEEIYIYESTEYWEKSLAQCKMKMDPGESELTLRRIMSYIYIYIYIYIYMEHPFLMFLDHTQRRSTVGRTPLDE